MWEKAVVSATIAKAISAACSFNRDLLNVVEFVDDLLSSKAVEQGRLVNQSE